MPHFPSVGMGQNLPGLQVAKFRAELLGLGRKSQPECSGQGVGVWAALIPPRLFPPEDPQADSSISPLPHLEAKILQTHSLARLLTKYAEQLLQEYVSRDGCGGARGLGNPEVQVTHFLNLVSQLQKLGLLREISNLPLATHWRRTISVPQMSFQPPQLGGSLPGALRQRQPESEANSGLGVRKLGF